MILSDSIFVGKADAIDLTADGEAIVDLDAALKDAAREATEVTILGGYYNAAWLLTLFRNLRRPHRRRCRVRIAVGIDATVTLPRVWEEMRKIRADLLSMGYCDVKISIVCRAPVHFHTKLFRFLHKTHPYWFVGSANPGSERHELMVRLSGRHAGLSGYVKAVFKAAVAIEEPVPKRETSTLREFLLAGVLCHKPPQQRLFTFDAYRFSPEDRRRIDARVGDGSGVDHASPRTEGFGFGLRSGIGMVKPELEIGDDSVTRTRFRDNSVDTLFGLWMPLSYFSEVKDKVLEQQIANERHLSAIGDRLCEPAGQQAAIVAFDAYITSMNRFLAELGIEVRPIRDRDAAFVRFLRSRTRSLSDAAFVARHARVMTFAPMFDVWQDPPVAEEFVRTFFEDLAWRASSPATRRPRIVRAILSRLREDVDWQTSEELQSAFETRLADEPWNESEW